MGRGLGEGLKLTHQYISNQPYLNIKNGTIPGTARAKSCIMGKAITIAELISMTLSSIPETNLMNHVLTRITGNQTTIKQLFRVYLRYSANKLNLYKPEQCCTPGAFAR